MADTLIPSESIFTSQADAFVHDLVRRFRPARDALLQKRKERQERFDAGELPNYLTSTADIRRDPSWKVADLPAALQDRRIEITGPVDRKMVINALNSPVNCFMADFEDSLSPTWSNISAGQQNLHDAVRRTITLEDPARGKTYALSDQTATLLCRVRGIHLNEAHVVVDGEHSPGCLVDFGYYLFHNARELLARGAGPWFYIPKLESSQEAAWWADVIRYAEKTLGLSQSTVRVTCLIETLPAVFEMQEILYELKEWIAALNCGRWDYIFSFIKTLARHSDRILPDRGLVTMDKPFLKAYSQSLVAACHKRGALAMGGMSAFIPQRAGDNAAIFEKVRRDKQLELDNGHDGTWVAHPGLASTVQNVFDETLGSRINQMDRQRPDDLELDPSRLLSPSAGACTTTGMRDNIRIGLQYVEAWISGNGCVPIYGLMEDAATAEISRASCWQWIHHGVTLDSGERASPTLFRRMLLEETQAIRSEVGEDRFSTGRFGEAADIFEGLTLASSMPDFLTLEAYSYLRD